MLEFYSQVKPITFWSYFDKKENTFVFNHAEMGHSEELKPQPKYPSQKWWNDAKWIKFRLYVNDDGSAIKDV